MSRGEFFDVCGRYGVSIFNYPDSEVAGELEKDLSALVRKEE
jgi:hypothetical protein